MESKIPPGIHGISDAQFVETQAYAEKMITALLPALDSVVKKFTESAYETIQNYVESSLESNTGYNLAELVRLRANDIIMGLLNGDTNKAEAERWVIDFDAARFRALVYAEHKNVIQNKLIDELVVKNGSLQKRLDRHEDYQRNR